MKSGEPYGIEVVLSPFSSAHGEVDERVAGLGTAPVEDPGWQAIADEVPGEPVEVDAESGRRPRSEALAEEAAAGGRHDADEMATVDDHHYPSDASSAARRTVGRLAPAPLQ